MFGWLFRKRFTLPKQDALWTSAPCDCKALRKELRDAIVDRNAARLELDKIKAKRSDTTRRGNMTKAAKLKVIRDATTAALADEIAARK
jgi:hypothetical protein